MAAIVERAIGGAGTGKTRLILDRLSQAKKELKLSVNEIGFCTFTRAGRAEIAARAADEWGVDPDALTKGGWFRTAHSIAYRQCQVGEGQLIEGQDGDAWTSEVLGAVVASRVDGRGERQYLTGEGGDETIPLSLKAWELARSKMLSVETVLERWSLCGEPSPSLADAKRVIRKYETAKRSAGRLDYTDVIAAFAGVRYTPDGPYKAEPEGEVPEGMRVLAIDEAQDSSALVDMVCRRLASSPSIERIWLCGDPYQSIHSFAGGDASHFMSWNAAESVMPQSYRCPARIMSLGEACLRQMRHGYRDRGIKPAGHPGSAKRVSSVDEAISRLSADSSALILGRCTYSLDEYESLLKAKGLPYLWVDKAGGSVALSGYAALWGLQHGKVIYGDDWANAVQQLAVKHGEFGELLSRGAKSRWKDGRMSHIDRIRPVDEDYELIGATPSLAKLISEGRWHLAIEPKSAERARMWLETATRYGESIASSPPIRLSTIHGAKGLEADTVICSSITSPSVERSRAALDDLHDEECRVAYVAVTRARRDFLLVDDGQRFRMEIPL